MKHCPRCDKSLPVESFSLNKSRADGRQAYCRLCRKEQKKAGPKYKVAPEQARVYQLKQKYNITADEYDEMLSRQGNRCAACPAVPIYREFAVDHDHDCCPARTSCGECIRGILCGPCNKALGWVQDSPERLESLAAYLRKK